MKTSGRLLSLLSLLQARRDWSGLALAERLDVSSRTVRRDVDRLRELGYPVTGLKGPDGGYRLEAGVDLPPLLFDDEQAVALTIALRTTAAEGGAIAEAAARALVTITQTMPTRLRARVDSLEFTPLSATVAPVAPAVLAALTATIHAGEVLRFDYASNPDDTPAGPARRAEPHHLVTRTGRWYLVGWDLDRQDWRTFRVDRIRPRTPNGPRFSPREVPGGDVSAFVAARFKGSDAADEWPCRGVVALDLPAAEVAPFVHDGVVEPLGPDRCRVAVGAWSWPALAASISRFDADIEVVGPAELRQAFAHLSRRLARAAAS